MKKLTKNACFELLRKEFDKCDSYETRDWFLKNFDIDTFLFLKDLYSVTNCIRVKHVWEQDFTIYRINKSLALTAQKVIRTSKPAERIDKLNEVWGGSGIQCKSMSMGSGGVGQIKYMKKLKEFRVQIDCGYGRNNYANAVIFKLKA